MAVIRIVALLTLMFGVWCQAATAEPASGRTGLQGILARKKLVVALLDTDYPPLFTTRKDGRLTGHSIDLVRHLAKELGVQAEFVRRARSFDGIIDIVSRGGADVGLGTSLTLARAKKVLFSQPYLTLNMALLFNRRRLIEAGITSQVSDLTELRQTTGKIGLLMDSAHKDYAQTTFPRAEIKAYRSLSALITAVRQGEILAAVRNDLTARLYLRRHPASVLQLQLFIDDNSKDYVAFAVHPDNVHLLFWLNTYLSLKKVNHTTGELVEYDDR